MDDVCVRLLAGRPRLRVALRRGIRDAFELVSLSWEKFVNWLNCAADWRGATGADTIDDSGNIVSDVKVGQPTLVRRSFQDGSGGLRSGRTFSLSASCPILAYDTVGWTVSGGITAYERGPTCMGNSLIGTPAVDLKGVKFGLQCVVAAVTPMEAGLLAYGIAASVPERCMSVVHYNAEDVRFASLRVESVGAPFHSLYGPRHLPHSKRLHEHEPHHRRRIGSARSAFRATA